MIPKTIFTDNFLPDNSYQDLLNEIKSRLQKAQLCAAISVNRELIQFYWEVGGLILVKQQNAKWGDKVFDALANDLCKSFPNTKGFSKTNRKYIRSAVHYLECRIWSGIA